MIQSASQSLAGRAAVLHLLPLSRQEVERFPRYPRTLDEALLSGGYPHFRSETSSFGLAVFVCRHLSGTRCPHHHQCWRFGYLPAFRSTLCRQGWAVAQPFVTGFGLRRFCPDGQNLVFGIRGEFHRLPSSELSGKYLQKAYQNAQAPLLRQRIGLLVAGHSRSFSTQFASSLRGAIFESWAVAEIIKHRMAAGDSNGVYFFRDKSGLEADALVQRARALSLWKSRRVKPSDPT